MDDLLVGGSNDNGHLKNLGAVLRQFQKYGLRVKLPQCVFMAQSVIYFGFRFSARMRKGQGHQGSTCPTQRDGVTILLGNVSIANQLHPQVIDPCPSFVRAPRWAIILSPFNYSIKSVPSKQNEVADALSRLPLPSTPNDEDSAYDFEERLIQSLPITHKEISYATRVDPILSKALE